MMWLGFFGGNASLAKHAAAEPSLTGIAAASETCQAGRQAGRQAVSETDALVDSQL